MTGLSTRQLENLLFAMLIIALLALSLSGCAPGDWGAFGEQTFWRDQNRQSGGGP